MLISRLIFYTFFNIKPFSHDFHKMFSISMYSILTLCMQTLFNLYKWVHSALRYFVIIELNVYQSADHLHRDSVGNYRHVLQNIIERAILMKLFFSLLSGWLKNICFLVTIWRFLPYWNILCFYFNYKGLAFPRYYMIITDACMHVMRVCMRTYMTAKTANFQPIYGCKNEL